MQARSSSWYCVPMSEHIVSRGSFQHAGLFACRSECPVMILQRMPFLLHLNSATQSSSLFFISLFPHIHFSLSLSLSDSPSRSSPSLICASHLLKIPISNDYRCRRDLQRRVRSECWSIAVESYLQTVFFWLFFSGGEGQGGPLTVLPSALSPQPMPRGGGWPRPPGSAADRRAPPHGSPRRPRSPAPRLTLARPVAKAPKQCISSHQRD